MLKKVQFYHNKSIDLWRMGCSLPNPERLTSKIPDCQFYPFPEGNKDLLEKILKKILGGHSFFFIRKAVVGKTKVFENHSQVSVLVNSIHTPNASRFLLDWTHAAKSTLIYKGSNQDPTKQNPLNIWSWPVPKACVRTAKEKDFTKRKLRKKMIVLELMAFLVTVTQRLRLWVAFILFLSVRKYNSVSLMSTLPKDKKQEKGYFTSVILVGEELFYRTVVGIWMGTKFPQKAWDQFFCSISFSQ